MVALDGVDGDVEEIGDAEGFQLLTDEGYLVAVGHDDADGLLGREVVGVEAVDAPQQVGDESGLGNVLS